MLDERFAPFGALFLRVALGIMWISHALLKLLVFTLPGTASFFESVGLAGFLAYPVFAAELVGGVAIVIGLYGRYVSLLLTPVLLVAVWVHLPNGWLHTTTGGGWEYPLFLAVASLAHAAIGDGALSVRSLWRGEAAGVAGGNAELSARRA